MTTQPLRAADDFAAAKDAHAQECIDWWVMQFFGGRRRAFDDYLGCVGTDAAAIAQRLAANTTGTETPEPQAQPVWDTAHLVPFQELLQQHEALQRSSMAPFYGFEV